MGAVDAAVLGVAVVVLLTGQLVPALVIAVVGVVIAAAREPRAEKARGPVIDKEPEFEVTMREWVEEMPPQTIDVEPEPAPLGPERMRFREPLLGECVRLPLLGECIVHGPRCCA